MDKEQLQELKKAVQAITKEYGLPPMTAAKIVGSIKEQREEVEKILNGDFSKIPAVCDSLGVKILDGSNKKNSSQSSETKTEKPKAKQREKKEEKKEEEVEKIEGEVIQSASFEGLPPSLITDIEGWIKDFCISYNIDDSKKIDSRQWNAVCMVIGEHIKQSGILRDREREAVEGGMRYSGEKLLAMLKVFEYICANYRQTAFSFLFPKFAGIPRNFFHDYEGRGLTSSRVQLVKKAEEIQNESIMNGIANGGGNAVPFIFLGKSVVGLQETTTVRHISDTTQERTAEALPDFGNMAAIEDKQGGES